MKGVHMLLLLIPCLIVIQLCGSVNSELRIRIIYAIVYGHIIISCSHYAPLTLIALIFGTRSTIPTSFKKFFFVCFTIFLAVSISALWSALPTLLSHEPHPLILPRTRVLESHVHINGYQQIRSPSRFSWSRITHATRYGKEPFCVKIIESTCTTLAVGQFN